MQVIARETLNANRDRLEAGAPFGDDIRARLEGARAVTDEDLAAAEEIRALFTRTVDAALADADVIVTPALPQCRRCFPKPVIRRRSCR